VVNAVVNSIITSKYNYSLIYERKNTFEIYVSSEAANPPDCRAGLRGIILDYVTNTGLQLKEILHEAIHTLDT
jgi:hypothetical protein